MSRSTSWLATTAPNRLVMPRMATCMSEDPLDHGLRADFVHVLDAELVEPHGDFGAGVEVALFFPQAAHVEEQTRLRDEVGFADAVFQAGLAFLADVIEEAFEHETHRAQVEG